MDAAATIAAAWAKAGACRPQALALNHAAARDPARVLDLPPAGLAGDGERLACWSPDAGDARRVSDWLKRAGFWTAPPLGPEDGESGRWVRLGITKQADWLEWLQHVPTAEPRWWSRSNPLAAALASGLAGGVLGWGAGRLAKAVVPGGLGRALPRLGMVLGGMGGAATAAPWAAANLGAGKSLLDGSTSRRLPPPTLKAALFRSRMLAQPGSASPFHVDVDQLGRTLWESALPPLESAAILGAGLGAAALAGGAPGPRDFGSFAARTGGDALRGAAAGLVLGSIVNRPPEQRMGLGQWTATGAALGMLAPALLGR